jgi:integrase
MKNKYDNIIYGYRKSSPNHKGVQREWRALSRGHIRQRGSSWAVVVELEPDARSGRRRQRWISGFKSRPEAARALPGILLDLDLAGAQPSTSRQTTAQYLRGWLETLPPRGLRQTTIDGYRVSIENHLIPHLGPTQLARLNSAQINAAYGDLLSRGRSNGKGGLSPRTVRLAHTILRKALADAVRWGQLEHNPAASADPPRVQRTAELRVWSAAEVRQFLDSIETHPLRTCYWLLATTGMRRGEALALTWRQVDFEHRRLSIVQSLVRTSSGPMFSPPKTARGRRSIALDQRTLEILRTHHQQQASNRAGDDDDLVFQRADGSPIPPHSVSKAFALAVQQAGLRKIPLHGLRHSHATLALRAGVHAKIVSERLGHASISLTLDVYSHVLPALDSLAAEQIATLLLPDSSTQDYEQMRMIGGRRPLRLHQPTGNDSDAQAAQSFALLLFPNQPPHRTASPTGERVAA